MERVFGLAHRCLPLVLGYVKEEVSYCLVKKLLLSVHTARGSAPVGGPSQRDGDYKQLVCLGFLLCLRAGCGREEQGEGLKEHRPWWQHAFLATKAQGPLCRDVAWLL